MTDLDSVAREEHWNNMLKREVVRNLLELDAAPDAVASVARLTKRSPVLGLALVQTTVVCVERHRVRIPTRMSIKRVRPRHKTNSCKNIYINCCESIYWLQEHTNVSTHASVHDFNLEVIVFRCKWASIEKRANFSISRFCIAKIKGKISTTLRTKHM